MDEIFTVTLSTPVNATLLDGQGLGTITDDDGFPSLSINDVTVTEANGGTVNAVFNVNLSNASGQTVSVAFATADGSAVAGADYTSASGTLEFTPGQLTRTITVPVTGDLLDEIDESFTVTLTNPTNASITDGIGLGTIADNDPTPTLVVNDVTVAEGDTGTTAATFTVTLSAPSGRAASVDYSTLNGSATAPADYAGVTGSLNFAAGETTKQVTVLVNGDTLDESNETYTLNLSNATNATILDASGTGTINDDDPLPSLSIDDVTTTEGDTGSVAANFTVTLSTISGRTVAVDFAAANGTATAPGDYTGTGGTLIFAAGETTKTVTVQVNGDTLDEANESYFVNLSNPSNATVTDGQGLGTINDDDAMPSLVIDDVSVTEGDTGTTNANFTVSLELAERPDRDRRLRDRERHRGRTGRLHGPHRANRDVHRRPADEDDHHRGQPRHDRRGQRDLLRQPLEPDERDHRGQPGRRHDHRRRRRAQSLGQRRHGHRGPERHGQREPHGLAVGPERAVGQRRLVDCRRHGGLARRLPGRRRQHRLRPGRHVADPHRAREQRHDGRDRRDVHGPPGRSQQRDDR